MILILILKQWLKYRQIAKPKSYKNFTDNAANVNTKKIMKIFMWPTVRTTWAEEKRICPDIISFGNLCESEEDFIPERITTRTMSQTVWG